MAKRIRIGLFYSYEDRWIAGTYYIENLINALDLLEEPCKPYVYALVTDENSFAKLKERVSYKYCYPFFLTSESYNFNFLERLVNKFYRTITKKNFIEKRISHRKVDVIFPLFQADADFIYNTQLIALNRKIFCIPDFQEHYLPHFFSEQEINCRKTNQKRIASEKTNIIFSSQDVLKDFKKFYPESQCRTFVLNFAVTHPTNLHLIDINQLREKYGIPEKYFFSPNQFWVHKNHKLVLKAVKLLKNEGINILVAFSGKNYDFRNPGYFEELVQFARENDLQENIKFLGFIDRSEQLVLMKHAIAIIQPSLFEGWSTVVEDAKALSQDIILSNLNVHVEQTTDYPNKCFFNPYDEVDLKEKIKSRLFNPIQKQEYPYRIYVEQFGKNFMKIVREIIQEESSRKQ